MNSGKKVMTPTLCGGVMTPICARFEACQPLIPQEAYLRPVYVRLGITFMNFEPKVILPILKSIAGEKGYVILATELITKDNSIEKTLSGYNIEECEEFSFGPLFARAIRKKRRSCFTDKWHIDEVRMKINGEIFWLWRLVDSSGEEIEILLQKRRNAKRLFGS